MKILVTGAAGFIGSHLVSRLTGAGWEVTGIDNMNDYYDPRLKRARLQHLCNSPLFEFRHLDIADRPAMEKLFETESFHAVIHMAAQAGVRYSITNPHSYVSSNLVGFMNILEGVRQSPCSHFVFASSSSVYGANTSVPFRESDSTDTPVSLYAATKKSNEVLAQSYSHLYGIPITALRFFTVYGPWGRPDMAIFKFVDAITAGRTIDLYNNGDLSRDFTFIDDIVEGVLRVMKHPPAVSDRSGSWSTARMRICNIGNQNPVQLRLLVRTIENALGIEARTRLLPMQEGDVYQTYASVEELFQVTGYNPRVSIEEGVKAFVRWYQSEYQDLLKGRPDTLPAPAAPLFSGIPVMSSVPA